MEHTELLVWEVGGGMLTGLQGGVCHFLCDFCASLAVFLHGWDFNLDELGQPERGREMSESRITGALDMKRRASGFR